MKKSRNCIKIRTVGTLEKVNQTIDTIPIILVKSRFLRKKAWEKERKKAGENAGEEKERSGKKQEKSLIPKPFTLIFREQLYFPKNLDF